MRRPSFSAVVKAAGYAAVAAALVAAALQLRSGGGDPAPVVAPAAGSSPLSAELARCHSVSVAGKADPDCEAAWAANRRHFFASSAAVPAKE